MAELNEDEQKALLAAGVVLGALGTFAALVKAALDRAAAKEADN
ncbi:hypothetical protein [Mycobacterium sp. IS-1556]|nr:hypothetical protein [Mycobacterium sp. IS-1556]